MPSNLYLPINRLKDSANTVGVTRDAELVAVVARLSREIERYTGRTFCAKVETRYFARRKGIDKAHVLWVDDLVSVSAVGSITADEVYGTSLVEATDFRLIRGSAGEPYRRLELIGTGTLISAWPTGYRGVQIAGTWGWSYDVAETGATLGEDMDTSETDWQLSSGGNLLVSLGETLKIDSEQVWVTAIASANTTNITVQRAVNGTTAAAHSNGATVYRREYPGDIEDVVLERSKELWRARQGSAVSQDMSPFGADVPQGGYARWMSVLRPFIRHSARFGE